MNKFNTKTLLTGGLLVSALALPSHAQESIDEVIVTGIKSSLLNALNEKRNSDNLIEVIQAEDIGKLPDQNLAEVLENVTGIQITRTAGVGSGVQIRGTNANRTEINGVSTVGSGSGRSGMDYEDISSAMISAVEVTKAPEAKTIEGSVGGTINLRTIRPLELDDRLLTLRFQGEDSSLSDDDDIMPRVALTYGDNWSNANGDFGVVLSISRSEQDVTAFRPRADRDNIIASDSGYDSAQSFSYLPIQFLNQDYDNFEYETTNIAGSFEWAPNDNLKLFFDAVINEQDRQQKSSRVQASGVSSLRKVSVPTSFETVNFGSLPGANGSQELGSIQAALTGVIGVDLSEDDDDPNLRFSSDTDTRETTSEIFRLGGDWNKGNWSGRVEFSTSSNDTTTPSFNTTLNFINPNTPLDAGGGNDNSVPFVYDLRGKLSFAVAQDAQFGPTDAQLLDPANVVLRDVNIDFDTADNEENALRADFSYDLEDNQQFGDFLSSVDFGIRLSETSSKRNQIRSKVSLRRMSDSPRGNLFSELLTPGPDNFGSGDGRALFVDNFLLINPDKVTSDPYGAIDILNAALTAHGSSKSISQPTSSQSAFFDIEEETTSLYAQANFEYNMFRGNFGVRYLETDVTSKANSILDGVTEPVNFSGNYDYLLPRFNVVATPREDLNLRFSFSEDIRRPDFDDLSASRTFSTSPNPPVSTGNPALVPEEVESWDVSAEWYFAPAAVVSLGYFNKKRTNLFVKQQEDPFEAAGTGYRDVTAPCEQGGIFNPIADVNVFGPEGGVGVCVPISTTINDAAETTQKGWELALQYDLSEFEEDLGWASGFGVLFNYTTQKFSGGQTVNNATSRASAVFAAINPATTGVTFKQPLIDLSEDSYNLTTYYEKYGISARIRYTWRDAYRSTDFGSTSSFPWGFPVVQGDREQVNASVSYAVNENLTLNVEGINLTESEVTQHCVNEGALLCYQGITDRRVTVGASYKF